MCGIAGVLARSAQPTRRMDAALDQMHHRGPDAQASWSAESSGSAVVLGHVR